MMILIHCSFKEAFETRTSTFIIRILFDLLVPQVILNTQEGNGVYSLARPLIDKIPSEIMSIFIKRAWKLMEI